MLTCMGYKMFEGIMRTTIDGESRLTNAVWLYRPEIDCWCYGTYQIPAECCEVFSDRTVQMSADDMESV